MTDQELIWNSLEAASEQCEDLAPPVYAKFFAVKPQISEIFPAGTREAPNIPMGNMIYELVVLITDGIDNGTLNSNTMSTLMTHIGWGIDMAMYRSLLDALTATVRDACGDEWSEDTMQAWHRRTNLIMDSLRANSVVIEHQLAGEEYAST